MLEQQLKKLQSIELNEQLMNEDYVKVQQRLTKKSNFKWQVPATIAAVFVVLFFIWLTSPTLPDQQTAATGPIEIESILVSSNGIDPTSIWYPGIKKVRDEKVVEEINKLMNENGPIFIGELNDVEWLHVRMTLKDGTSKLFLYYLDEKFEVLYEPATGYAYQIPKIDSPNIIFKHLYYDLETKKLAYITLLIPFTILFFRWRNEKKMLKETGLLQKLPIHSSKWQSISNLVIYGGIFIFAITTYKLHLFVFISLAIVNTIICLEIEKRGENNRWRKQNFLLQNSYIVTFVYIWIYKIL